MVNTLAMKRTLLLLSFVCPTFFSISYGQTLKEFSENTGEFVAQLGEYMTAGKVKELEDSYKLFEESYRTALFTDEERVQIQHTSNLMLGQRMSAKPYFQNYLAVLALVKKAENGAERFVTWHTVADSILNRIENRKVQPFQEFLEFSLDFFNFNALNYSKSGVSWYADAATYKMKFAGGQPVIEYDKVNLIAGRKGDSIVINQTQGYFLPVQKQWVGKKGTVSWERLNLGPEVYVELDTYRIEINKSIYEAPNVRLHYPAYFGNRAITGSFSDKLVASNDATEGSYPRFESQERVLKIEEIGEGIEYTGGFRLQGTTVYGYGSTEEKAKIRVLDKKKALKFRTDAELFVIRRGERIAAERAECVLYNQQDTFYHPSVNIKFEIPTQKLELERGQRGSDRTPFFSSIHQANIDAEKITVYFSRDSMVIGEKGISLNKKKDVSFESLQFFRESDYRRIQNIATANPIAIMKATAEREGNIMDASLLASRINSKFTVDNIQSLLYDLVSQGFINYDPEKQLIEIKEKVFHFTNASQGKTDYDVMKIVSKTDEVNALLNMRNNEMDIFGVNNVEFSAKQQVGAIPYGNAVIMKANRSLDFSGRLFAGFGLLSGRKFHFDYDRFQIGLDSVRFFDLYLPTGELDSENKPIAKSLGSRLEYLSGVLLIDAPANKSGKDDIPIFPSLQSKEPSFVFYDYKFTQDSVYTRDSFYFKLDPFSFDHLDKFGISDLKFKGELVSANIFPNIRETLVLQDEDVSLGFLNQSPANGYAAYTGKGNYTGKVHLSNKGLLGQGTLKYLGAVVNATDFIFRPKKMTASADRFDLEEERKPNAEVPQVRGADVTIDWRPYQDSMYVRSKDAPFNLFKPQDHQLRGMLVLTPGGLKGVGTLDWPKASMTSDLFSFGAFSALADTTDLNIKTLEPGSIALKTSNLNGKVDFDKNQGTFVANDAFVVTTLPYNQYQTSMNEFTWDMAEETITFKSDDAGFGKFLSIHPDQDSLKFDGKTAFYDLKTNELRIGGIPHIVAADAFIYPDSGKAQVLAGGVMTTLNNARIVADTLNKYHVINRATVDIKGKKLYTASGFYEYNIGDRKQEIEFASITGQRVGKGAMSEKAVVTRAKGEVTPDDNFYIDRKTEFRGDISLSADSRNLQFEGFARLDAPALPERHWFTVNCEGDKNNLAIRFDVPKNYEGVPLQTGLYLSKEMARVYPRVMMPLYFRKDRPILPVKGLFKFDPKGDRFIFGDSLKIAAESILKGNQLIFNNKDGSVAAEGKFELGSALGYASIAAAGRATTAFEMAPDSLAGNAPSAAVLAEFMAGITINFPDRLLKMMALDIKSSSFDALTPNYKDKEFYKKAISELFPEGKETTNAIEGLNLGAFDVPAKFNNFSFLFSRMAMKWDPDYQSFITREPKSELTSIAGEPIQKQVTCYAEFKMPTNEDDRIYLYIKSPSDYYYYFDYRQGILSVVSNNTKFNDEIINMKEKERIIKMPDGENYEIQPINPGTAEMFIRRIQAVK